MTEQQHILNRNINQKGLADCYLVTCQPSIIHVMMRSQYILKIAKLSLILFREDFMLFIDGQFQGPDNSGRI